MIRIAIGIVIGIMAMTTFPEQTVELSEFMRQQINVGAEYVVDQTREENLVDKIRN